MTGDRAKAQRRLAFDQHGPHVRGHDDNRVPEIDLLANLLPATKDHLQRVIGVDQSPLLLVLELVLLDVIPQLFGRGRGVDPTITASASSG
ncbi:MAG TPA: hypothetical protein VGY91_13260 [Chthoniobacterales bacterium]|nr:hypothetical protein [Chthoniobacterales bacterium]